MKYGLFLSLTDLFHLAYYTLALSTSLQMTRFSYFLWLSNIPQVSGGHLGFFRNLAIVDNAAINIRGHVPHKTSIFAGHLGGSVS